MKFIVPVLVSLLVLQGATQKFLSDEGQVVLQILQGVIEGMSAEAHIDLNTIKACIQDPTTVYTDLKSAIDLLKSNDSQKVQQGIKLIGEAIQVLPDAINACQASQPELVSVAQEITKVLAELRNPSTFAYQVGQNLLVNGVEIFQETQTAVKDWFSSKYEDFGVQIGKIVVQFLVKKVQGLTAIDSSLHDVMTVYQGVVKGFYAQGGLKIEDLQTCIGHSEGVVYDFIGGVQLIATKDQKNVQEGLRILGMALQILPEAMSTCGGAVTEYLILSQKLNFAIDQLQTPQTFAFHVGKDLLVNGRDIYTEINAAVVDWNKNDYADFGYQLGKALYQLFVGVSLNQME